MSRNREFVLKLFIFILLRTETIEIWIESRIRSKTRMLKQIFKSNQIGLFKRKQYIYININKLRSLLSSSQENGCSWELFSNSPPVVHLRMARSWRKKMVSRTSVQLRLVESWDDREANRTHMHTHKITMHIHREFNKGIEWILNKTFLS